MDSLGDGANAATIGASVVAVGTAIAGAIFFPARWVLALINTERTERTKEVAALWGAVDDHRKEEAAHRLHMSNTLQKVATRDDLKAQTDLILTALHISGRKVKDDISL